MTAIVEQVVVRAVAQLAAAFPGWVVRRNPGDPADALQTLDVWDGQLECRTPGNPQAREYALTLDVDLYAVDATALNAAYVAAVQALEADPPLGGLAVAVVEKGRRPLAVDGVEGHRAAMAAAVEFEIVFWTAATDLSAAGP